MLSEGVRKSGGDKQVGFCGNPKKFEKKPNKKLATMNVE